ncbi:MAG TPA: TIGR03667 family PPOX class F420-dependent oxidoreductase [Candidatus Methylomirabilis sp.]
MARISWKTLLGRKAARRFKREKVVWLTTMGKGGQPQPRPVWFLFDGKSFLIYSRARARKLAHIRRAPNVALHLNSDPDGDDVVVLLGRARIDPKAPRAHEVPAYLRKYRKGIASLGSTPAQFAAEYSQAIRITPTALRGF